MSLLTDFVRQTSAHDTRNSLEKDIEEVDGSGKGSTSATSLVNFSKLEDISFRRCAAIYTLYLHASGPVLPITNLPSPHPQMRGHHQPT